MMILPYWHDRNDLRLFGCATAKTNKARFIILFSVFTPPSHSSILLIKIYINSELFLKPCNLIVTARVHQLAFLFINKRKVCMTKLHCIFIFLISLIFFFSLHGTNTNATASNLVEKSEPRDSIFGWKIDLQDHFVLKNKAYSTRKYTRKSWPHKFRY